LGVLRHRIEPVPRSSATMLPDRVPMNTRWLSTSGLAITPDEKNTVPGQTASTQVFQRSVPSTRLNAYTRPVMSPTTTGPQT